MCQKRGSFPGIRPRGELAESCAAFTSVLFCPLRHFTSLILPWVTASPMPESARIIHKHDNNIIWIFFWGKKGTRERKRDPNAHKKWLNRVWVHIFFWIMYLYLNKNKMCLKKNKKTIESRTDLMLLQKNKNNHVKSQHTANKINFYFNKNIFWSICLTVGDGFIGFICRGATPFNLFCCTASRGLQFIALTYCWEHRIFKIPKFVYY